MRKETRELVYMMLDLLDSLYRTSKNAKNFITIDETVLKEVREELFSILRSKNVEEKANIKNELIGILPSVLIDKKHFPTNATIVELAERSLGFSIPNWKKKSRDEIIGILITKIAEKNEDELELFVQAWKKFTKIKSSENQPVDGKEENFVDLWLDFFELYKKNITNRS